MYSHLYSSMMTHSLEQMALFDKYISIARSLLNDDIVTHISATNGMDICRDRYDMTRAGIGLYVGDGKQLIDAVTLYSRVQSIRHIKSGEFVGYSCQFVAKCDIIVAVVFGGYADGIDRRLTGLRVKVGEGYGTIIGDICMDVFFVDITSAPHARVGDIVTIIGADNGIEQVARHMDTISYELLTGLCGRVTRSYIDERCSEERGTQVD